MKIKAIAKECLDSIKEAAKDLYPREFLAFLSLGDTKDVISELVLLPQMIYGKGLATFNRYMAPFDPSLVGTVHSHPSGVSKPSGGDLDTFRKHGRIHIIIAYPYTDETWRAYTSNGDPIELMVVK